MNSSLIKMKLQNAKGVRDIPPEEKIIKNQIITTLREVFELYGFSPLETPIIERYETLAAKGGAGNTSDVMKETFKLSDQGKRKLGLRFELTTSLARFMGMNPMLNMPFKRYEIGPVFRDGPLKLGRYRQFYQCDIDIIGCKNMLAEAEILAVVDTFFKKIGLDTIIKVNNRKLLNGILEQAGINKKEEAIISIDKLEKIGIRGVTKEMLNRGYKQEQINKVFELIDENVSLDQLKEKITNDEGKEGLKELIELFNYLDKMKIDSVKFDVSLARGLAYYTGTVYEAFMKEGKMTSSIAGGGRWNGMIGKFLEKETEVPAAGVSFGIAPIMDVIKEKQDVVKKSLSKIHIVPIKTTLEALNYVQELRNKGINVSFDLNNRNLSKNLKYANALGISYVGIIGEDEISKKKILLRDMKTGDQQLLSINGIIKKLK